MSYHRIKVVSMKKRPSKTTLDIIIIAITLFSFYLMGLIDLFEKIVEFTADYEKYEIDKIISTFIVLVFCLAWFSTRRWRKKAEANDIIHEIIKNTEQTIEGCQIRDTSLPAA